jgi:hypothetical protein
LNTTARAWGRRIAVAAILTAAACAVAFVTIVLLVAFITLTG